MPDDLLNLNLGQVQAVIDGYSERILDSTIQFVWTGYYAAYFFSKHPKKPTEIIQKLIHESHKKDSSPVSHRHDVDMDAEIELFAKRDLAFLQEKGGN